MQKTCDVAEKAILAKKNLRKKCVNCDYFYSIRSSTQIMREIALFSGKIYTAGTNFTRLPVATVATNLNSAPPFEQYKNTAVLEKSYIPFVTAKSCYRICAIAFDEHPYRSKDYEGYLGVRLCHL